MDKKQVNEKIRTRIAPSPTGWLHLGTARSALFNYLFAKKFGGKFVLRIEDTDLERSDSKFTKEIVQSLHWLGINWDEGPEINKTDSFGDFGNFGSYFQSRRTDVYEKFISQLINNGSLFWCHHTAEELEAEKQDQMSRGEAPRHICSYHDGSGRRENGLLRFRAPRQKIVFDDLIRGSVEFDGSLLGDIGVARDEKTPLYNLAVVIDDFTMEISHVIRGEDHISNTPKQLLLQEILGFPKVKYAHLPLILGPDRSKLSKRHGATSIMEFKEQGYLPEAIINYLAFLGWNPGTTEEIFSMDELIEKFSIDRVQKGGAVFNIGRLDWMNAQYIKKMPTDKLANIAVRYIFLNGEKENLDLVNKIVQVEKERMQKVSQIGEASIIYMAKPEFQDVELLRWKKMSDEELINNLNNIYEKLSSIEIENFNTSKINEVLMQIAKEKGDNGSIYWPLRVALSGKKISPSPAEIAFVIGREETLDRINLAINFVKQLNA